LYESHNYHGKFELMVTPNPWQAHTGIYKLCHINQHFSWQQWIDTWHITDIKSWQRFLTITTQEQLSS
jgi:hypothetical protein